MVSLVESMLDLHRRLAAARTPQEQTALERQIAATDTQIDRLVAGVGGRLSRGEVGDAYCVDNGRPGIDPLRRLAIARHRQAHRMRGTGFNADQARPRLRCKAALHGSRRVGLRGTAPRLRLRCTQYALSRLRVGPSEAGKASRNMTMARTSW